MFYWPFYTREGTYSHDSTATEANTYTTGLANFTEILHEDYSFSNTGDSVTGDYTNTINDGLHSSSLEAFTTNGSGDYTVTQTTLGSFFRNASGNLVDGSYLTIDEGTDEYTVTQIGAGTHDFTLTIVGTNSYTDEVEGNTILGDYTQTKTGTDEFTITIDGTKIGGSYSQTVTGTEDYTLEDIGNSATGHYTRTINSEGTYDRTSTGSGATKPTDNDDYGYEWTQTGDPHSGTFDLSQTGTDRYDLLEDFFDISNTQAGQTPGHMNVYPFGQTFVDPFSPAKFLEAVSGFLVGQQPPLRTLQEATGGTGNIHRAVTDADGLLTPAQIANMRRGLNVNSGVSVPVGSHHFDWAGSSHNISLRISQGGFLEALIPHSQPAPNRGIGGWIAGTRAVGSEWVRVRRMGGQ
jgi:hypothetical protein